MADGIDLRGPGHLRRLILASSALLVACLMAAPALADGCTTSGSTKNCELDFGSSDYPVAESNNGSSGSHDSPDGTGGGALNFSNYGADFDIDSSEAGSTGVAGLIDAVSNGGNGDDSGDAGAGGAVYLYNEGYMALDVDGASNLQAFLKVLSIGGSGDCCSNDDNNSDGGKGGAGGSARIESAFVAEYKLTGTIDRAFYGFFVQSVGGAGGQQNDSVFGDQLGGAGGNAGTAEIDNSSSIYYGSSSSRVQASSTVSALTAESIAGSGGYNNGDAGNAGAVTIHNDEEIAEIRLYLNTLGSGQNVYGLYGYSRGGAGNASSDNSDRGGDGGNGGNVTISNAAEVSLDITGDSTGTGAAIAAISDGGKGGQGPDKDEPGGNGGSAGDIDVSVSGDDTQISTTGDNVFGILAESLGGQGGDGSDSTAVAGTGGGGGFGGDAGTVTVTTNSGTRIETSGAYASAIAAMSLGGGGGTGSDFTSVLGGSGGNGGNGGDASLVTVNNDAELDTTGDFSFGILGQSIAGSGGTGGVADGLIVELGGDGGAGGTPGVVDIDNSGTISTAGYGANGILAQSIGGGGGAAGSAGGIIAVGGNAPVDFEADGGTVTVDNTGHITTVGDAAVGMLGQSVGGGGGSATGAEGIVAVGGQGSAGGDGGSVTTEKIGTITTGGEYAFGLLAQSVGGGGGNGGNVIDFSTGVSTGIGGNAAGGGDGGTVTVDNTTSGTHGTIKTSGYQATGLFAQSVGGGGGTGGDAIAAGLSVVTVQVGGYGGGGGDGGAVTVDQNELSVTTAGNESVGLLAQSVGGGGGDGGGAQAYDLSVGLSLGIAVGGSGGVAGDGGDIAVTLANGSILTGTEDTPSDNSTALLAQSTGGGGGTGGKSKVVNLVVGVPVDEDLNTFSASLNVGAGGSGGAGGKAGTVNVYLTDTLLTTYGQYSMGIHALANGGGGGSGGDASVYSLTLNNPTTLSVNLQGTAAVGGLCTASNCAGGDGGDISVDVNSTGDSSGSQSGIFTAGDYANGILAQSIGGGNGGAANATLYGLGAKVEGQVALSVGAKGGVGGDGGTATVNLDENGWIQTGGVGARGIIAQSIGGGGGTSQGVSIFGSGSAEGSGTKPKSASVSLDVGVGLTGGAGGDGNIVAVANDGQITTAGRDSDGVVAQSIGGGGGMGGSLGADSGWTLDNVSNAIKQLKDIYDRFHFGINGDFNVEVGGKGGTGGTGGTVTVTHDGAIMTDGDYADGIVAQSIGGGGGIGGSSDVDGYRSVISANVAVGGKGGTGGAGGTVAVDFGTGGGIQTNGYSAYGVLAQSIGGGGGMGGDGSAISNATLNIGSGTGGGGGSGDNGGEVGLRGSAGTVITHGDNSHGIVLQSVGNGGGTGGVGNTGSGDAIAGLSLELAIGGAGGDAGNGGNVYACAGSYSCGDFTITTTGERAVGLLAQSVGGGGGVGSAGDPGKTTGLSYSVALDLGGSGGSGGNGGNVSVGELFTIATQGDMSVGILAQSIGGGGGYGAAGYQVDSLFSGDRTLSVNLGGSGGSGGNGNLVDVTTRYNIGTLGDWAHGVLAQSIGGGGGVAGTSMATLIDGDQTDQFDLSVIVGGGQESGHNAFGDSRNSSNGDPAVTVEIGSAVTTSGTWAMGVVAQSIGGGGGVGNGSMQADGEATATSTVSVGGGTASSGNGGDVLVEAGTDFTNGIATTGMGAYGILAQSIGGGGGLGTAMTSAYAGEVSVGGGGSGSGGTVTFKATKTITTTGADAHAVVLQSIGGGGGVGAISQGSASAANAVTLGGSGAGGNGDTVSLDATLNIATTGARSFGVIAQSIGGGGGIATAGPASSTHSPDDCCSSSLTIGGSAGGNGGDGGDGGAVNLSFGEGSVIVTSGYGSHAIVAQSIGGGGGYGGDASGPISLAPRVQSSANGQAGSVTVAVDGTVTTTNSYAFGVIAQSIGSGGGFGGDQSGAFAGTTSENGSGHGNLVTVTQSGSINATGAGSVGIFAQSQGPQDQNVVTVNVSGSVTGGSGDQGAGIWISAGKNNVLTVNSGGSVSAVSGTAIRYSGDAATSYGSWLTLDNYGTITGDILMNNADSNSAGTINNQGIINPAAAVASSAGVSAAAASSGGVLVGASLYEANIVNGGTLIVGHGGKTDGTEITGDFSQSSGGTLSLDIDMASGKSDRLTVRGDAMLGGKLDINAASLLPRRDLVFLSVEGAVAGALETSANLAFDFDIARSGQDYSLSASADLDRVGLDRSNDAIADHLQAIWDADGNEDFGALFATLYDGAGQGEDTYASMLAGLLPGVSLAPAARFQQTIIGFNDSLMSCPKTSAGGLMLGETSCVWADISGGRFDRNGSSGYSDDAITYRMGTQVDLAPGWFLGLSGAYQHSKIDGDDGLVSGSGDAGFLGAALKREAGPWLFAGVISGSYGGYDMRRQGIPGLAGSAESSPDVYGGSLRFRVARTFANTDYYIKPYLDLDAVYTRMSGYTESGAGVAGLQVDSSDEFAFVASPMIEIGGAVALGADYMLRPYAFVGASFSTADEWTAEARLSGAPAGVGMFEASLPMDDVIARIGAGLHLSKVGGIDIELQYAGEFSDDTSSNTGMLRVNVPF